MDSNKSDCSSSDHNTKDDSHSHKLTAELNSSLEYVIFDLKRNLGIYERKAKENMNILENLECTTDLLNDCDKVALRNCLSNIDVLAFDSVGGEPLVNLQKILQSLHVNDQLSKLHKIKLMFDSMRDDVHLLLDEVQRKHDVENTKGTLNEENICDQEARRTLLKVKKDLYSDKLKGLKDLTGSFEKPKYTLEEISELRKEDELKKEKLAILKSELLKYEGLSPDMNEAKASLYKLQEHLKSVETQLKERCNL